MKKIILFAILFCFAFGNAQIIEFENLTLKEYLLGANASNGRASTGTATFNAIGYYNQPNSYNFFGINSFQAIDTNGDNEIDVNEAAAITYLVIAIDNIFIPNPPSSVALFSMFPNLKYLYINELGTNFSIDLSPNTALEMIYSPNYGIPNISQNFALTHIMEVENDTTNIDLSIYPNLQVYISIYSSVETTFNFTENPNLTFLKIWGYEFDVIDLTQNTLLQFFSFISNTISNLDLSQNTELAFLNISNCSINYLNLKNGNPTPWNSSSFVLNLNSNLQYVCADEEDFDYLDSVLSNNVNINSYCTLNPGGTFYEVSGNTFIGTNETNCTDTEVVYPFLKFNVSNETGSGIFYGNASGNHNLVILDGINTITPELENPDYFNVSPSSITVEFPATESPFEQHFCVTPNGIYHDLEVTVVPLGNAVPGFDASYKILYKNKGNQPENPSLTFTYDDAVLDFLSSSVVPNTTMSGLLSWNLEPLNVFESGFIIVNFNLNTPMETPPLNSDDVLSFQSLIIVGDLPDVNPEDNNFTLNQLVVNSYDPNDKTCLEGQSIHPDMIGEFIHYRIRFENTGTFPAQNVVIKDMIDEEKFDIATLQMVDASHDCRTRIAGQKVEFIFEDIQLDFNDETNDGYVVFKIKTLPTLTLNSTISNTAEIYFDFNFPIITNTETSTFEIILNNENFTFENELILHPNPAKNSLYFTSVNGILIQDIEIYNLQGQKVMEVKNASQNLDVSRLQAGTYLIKVFTNQGSSHAKFVKE
uniref:T9SS type A sorting domain-containing protein n=1 Tax=Flavobacterium sp. TaxID=239 RepID=UPI00404A7789